MPYGLALLHTLHPDLAAALGICSLYRVSLFPKPILQSQNRALQGIKGVPPLKEGLNPATWMLEVSTPGAEQRTGVDFAEIYKDSDFARQELQPTFLLNCK